MKFGAALSALLATIAVAHAAEPKFPSSAGDISVQTVASGLVYPWSLAFLPDGRMLVTERRGRMRIVSRNGQLSRPLRNVPSVFAVGQGGLLDVILDRDFVQNRTIYFSYAQPFNGGGRTTLARARLDDNERPQLADIKVIYQQQGRFAWKSLRQSNACRQVTAACLSAMVSTSPTAHGTDTRQ